VLAVLRNTRASGVEFQKSRTGAAEEKGVKVEGVCG